VLTFNINYNKDKKRRRKVRKRKKKTKNSKRFWPGLGTGDFTKHGWYKNS
jgi:hypothetical protein